MRVNCATLPDTLLESELFGHERGAFTGAEKLRIGRFEQGNGGSVFLDEISDVTLSTQAKLLRVLQEHEFERLGSNRTIKVDVRIIATTNKDLEKEVAEGRFREDLYYRLNVVTIKIPPLRERDGDVELLAEYFLDKYSRSLNKKIRKIDPAAMQLLKGYRWPGNIRELENTMERAVLMTEADVITTEDLSLPFKPEPVPAESALRILRRHQVGRHGKGAASPGPRDEQLGAERRRSSAWPDDPGPQLQDQAVRNHAPQLEAEQIALIPGSALPGGHSTHKGSESVTGDGLSHEAHGPAVEAEAESGGFRWNPSRFNQTTWQVTL